MASEFRYRRLLPLTDTLTIAISQSGANRRHVFEALRAARCGVASRRCGLRRVAGARVMGLVNVVGSTIAREADAGGVLQRRPRDRSRVDPKRSRRRSRRGPARCTSGGPAPGLETGPWSLVKSLNRAARPERRTLHLGAEVRELAERYGAPQRAVASAAAVSFPRGRWEGALKAQGRISLYSCRGLSAANMKHGPIALDRTRHAGSSSCANGDGVLSEGPHDHGGGAGAWRPQSSS